MRFWDIAACIGAGIGALFILNALLGTASAVQQAAIAAIGIGIALMPYIVSATLHRGRAERDRAAAGTGETEAT